ncbi:MAG: hypothetical protein U0528_17140 [Anaerolineae bacterium]
MVALDRISPSAAANRLSAIDDNYQRTPIREGFNWDEAFADAIEGQWYLVVFRSRHAATADEHLLTEFDKHAVEAAKLSPGFIFYFAGTPCSEGFCVFLLPVGKSTNRQKRLSASGACLRDQTGARLLRLLQP